MKRESVIAWLLQIRKVVLQAQSSMERCVGRAEEDAGVSDDEIMERLGDLEKECRHALGSCCKLRKVMRVTASGKRRTAAA